MYRGKPWTMRMFAGFGTPEDTNQRFKFLLEHGQTGLSTAFDMPTLMGYDPDHPRSLGEVGREGVSVASLDDMMRLFGDIPLDKVSTSMTINAPAAVLLALYVAVAEQQGVAPDKLRGTLQNDMLKEFIAQKEWISPIRAHMRIIRDMLVYCTREMPLWNTISISGYHIREAGATAVQELAFTIADGIGYVQLGIEAGLDVDEFGPRLSFFFDVHNDFFEEIAKFRAARRMWARIMRERFGARNPRSWLLRTHAQTAGVSLMAQQPLNNVVRTTMQALAAVLAGPSRCTPTRSTRRTRCRPRRRRSWRSGPSRSSPRRAASRAVADPLGGSYFVEALTDRMEAEAMAYIDKIDAMGGIDRRSRRVPAARDRALGLRVPAQRRCARSGHRRSQSLQERGGPGHRSRRSRSITRSRRAQIERIATFRAARDAAAARRCLAAVRTACKDPRRTSCRPSSSGQEPGHARRDLRHLPRGVRGPHRPGLPLSVREEALERRKRSSTSASSATRGRRFRR
jgi:methylmalonyl-CoA mutase N-terminal domain/subunit